MPIFSKVLRAGEGKTLKQFQGIVAAVNDVEPEIEALDDEALRAKTASSGRMLAQGDFDDLEVEAFAVVRRRRNGCWASGTTTSRSSGAGALHRGAMVPR